MKDSSIERVSLSKHSFHKKSGYKVMRNFSKVLYALIWWSSHKSQRELHIPKHTKAL